MIGIIFSATTAVLMGYSVTNFGTLWRMRPVVAIPLWMMAIALSPHVDASRGNIQPRTHPLAEP